MEKKYIEGNQKYNQWLDKYIDHFGFAEEPAGFFCETDEEIVENTKKLIEFSDNGGVIATKEHFINDETKKLFEEKGLTLLYVDDLSDEKYEQVMEDVLSANIVDYVLVYSTKEETLC